MKSLIKIGRISGTHHLKGTLKINTTLDNLELLENQKVMLVDKNSNKTVLQVSRISRLNNKKIVVDFSGVDNKNKAQKLMDYWVYARREQLNIPEDELVTGDLLEMEVKDLNLDTSIGIVEDILENGAQEILIIKGNDGEIMVPYIENFVKEIDRDNGVIFVELIEGMI